MTHRSATAVAWIALIAGAFADLALPTVQRSVNGWRIIRQAPPFLEFSLLQIGFLFAFQTAMIVAVWLFLRRRTASKMRPRCRWVALGLLLFLFVRAIGVLGGYRAPTYRGRLAITSSELRTADFRIADFWRWNGRPPSSLVEAGMDPKDILDGWGFYLRYVVDPDGHGFTLKSVGAPDRLRALSGGQFELEVNRRLGAPPGEQRPSAPLHRP